MVFNRSFKANSDNTLRFSKVVQFSEYKYKSLICFNFYETYNEGKSKFINIMSLYIF